MTNSNTHSNYTASGFFLMLAITLLNVGLIAWPNSAEAKIFKCVGANGDISYNQIPCPPAQETAKILAENTSQNANVDCRIANNFARQTALSMRAGRSSGEIFDSYGGIDAMPRTSIGVINYVYSHKDNINTGAQRITALSAARCSGGSYGAVSCDDFPYNFVAKLGGCDAAALSKSTNQSANNQPDVNGASNVPVGAANSQSMGARTTDETFSEDCKQNARAQLSNLFVEMRAGQSARAQSELNDRRDDLRDALSNC